MFFVYLRPSPQHPAQPSITEISRSPSPNDHTKQSRKCHSLPPPCQKSQKYSPSPPAVKKPRKYAYFCDFLLAAILGDLFDNRSRSSRKFRSKWHFVQTAKFIMRLLKIVYVPLNVVTVIFKVLIPCKLELILSVV